MKTKGKKVYIEMGIDKDLYEKLEKYMEYKRISSKSSFFREIVKEWMLENKDKLEKANKQGKLFDF